MKTTTNARLGSTKFNLTTETIKSLRVNTAVKTGGAPLKCPTDTSMATRHCNGSCGITNNG